MHGVQPTANAEPTPNDLAYVSPCQDEPRPPITIVPPPAAPAASRPPLADAVSSVYVRYSQGIRITPIRLRPMITRNTPPILASTGRLSRTA